MDTSTPGAVASTRTQKLTNRYEADVWVPFPLTPIVEGEEANPGSSNGTNGTTSSTPPASSSWLSDEAYQTYSVRGGTDKWRDNLRRRVEMHKFQSLHGDSELLKAIMHPRGRGGASSKHQYKLEKSGPKGGGGGGGAGWGGGAGKRRRGWEDRKGLYGRGRGEGGEDDDDDEEENGRPSVDGKGEAAVGRLIKLGPVAKLRNSSLTLQEHQTYQTLARKADRAEKGYADARPLTGEERQTLERLDPLVRAEQVKYTEQLHKWRESGRAPYRMLEKALGPRVDAFLEAVRTHQTAALPQHYQQHFKSSMVTTAGETARAEPAIISCVKLADASAETLRVPDLPVDMPKGEAALEWGPADQWRLERMGVLGEKEYVFEEGDILVDLPTLMALADHKLAWTIPFTVRALQGDGEKDEEEEEAAATGKKVLVLHPPLLPPVMSMRERADLYYGRVVWQELSKETPKKEEGGGDHPTLSLEAWQVAQLRVVVASERVALAGAVEAPEALFSVETDYTLEWSEEVDPFPQGTIRDLLYHWVGNSATPYVAKVDGKNARLAKMVSLRDTQRFMDLQATGHSAVFMGEMVTRLLHVLGLLQRQAEGQFVARHDPEAKEMVVYHHVPGVATAGRADALDLHAYIAESGKVDDKAASAWRKWAWPSEEQHIPGTFVPRQA